MNQNIVITEDAAGEVAALIRLQRYGKVILVTGKTYSGWMELLQQGSSCELVHWQLTNDLPSMDQLNQVRPSLHMNPDLVIAVGGGRIIDLAKVLVQETAVRKKPVFAVVPTTAGSGSEATPFAVLYNNKVKQSIQDAVLLPDHVYLDHTLVQNQPPLQRAISGFDALSQSIESLWNKANNAESENFAFLALGLLYAHLTEFINTPASSPAKDVQWAAYLAGKAIGITKTTGCHALSYYLTAEHGVPHGQAVAYFLPMFFAYNDIADYPNQLKIYGLLQANDGVDAARKISDKMRGCGLKTKCESSMNVDIDALIDSVNQERFANNPAPYNKPRLREFIEKYLL